MRSCKLHTRQITLPATQDEAAEQLRGLANLAALVGGFDMVAFVQFGFDPTVVPKPVLIGFAITNALTVRHLGSTWVQAATSSFCITNITY